MTGISGAAAARAADAMIQTLGGAQIVLVFAAAAQPGETASQLGLVDPGVVQIPIAPVLINELTRDSGGPRRRMEVLASNGALSECVSQRSVASADVLFETALGLVYCGEMFHIEGFVVERLGGVSYLFRVIAVS